MNVLNFKSIKEVLLTDCRIKECVGTLLIVFWDQFLHRVKIMMRDRCTSIEAGQRAVIEIVLTVIHEIATE